MKIRNSINETLRILNIFVTTSYMTFKIFINNGTNNFPVIDSNIFSEVHFQSVKKF